MARVVAGRYTAGVEGDFVVFLIGMRVNKPWKVHKWLPVMLAMGPMLKELRNHPGKGMLGATGGFIGGGPAVVQYWRSFDDLERFAHDMDDPHRPAWQRFNRAIGSSGDVGIWHETYRVRAGEYECVYGNMPEFGLAKAATHVPVASRGDSAAARLGGRSG